LSRGSAADDMAWTELSQAQSPPP